MWIKDCAKYCQHRNIARPLGWEDGRNERLSRFVIAVFQMKSKNNVCEWHSRFFCDQTGFIVIYSNPGPTPSFITTQCDSSTGNASPAGSKKADLCCLLFFYDTAREKSQQSSCLEILSVFPSLALFLFCFLILRIFASGLPVHVSLRQQSCCATEQYPVFFSLAGAWEEGKVGSFQRQLCQFDRSSRR